MVDFFLQQNETSKKVRLIEALQFPLDERCCNVERLDSPHEECMRRGALLQLREDFFAFAECGNNGAKRLR